MTMVIIYVLGALSFIGWGVSCGAFEDEGSWGLNCFRLILVIVWPLIIMVVWTCIFYLSWKRCKS